MRKILQLTRVYKKDKPQDLRPGWYVQQGQPPASAGAIVPRGAGVVGYASTRAAEDHQTAKEGPGREPSQGPGVTGRAGAWGRTVAPGPRPARPRTKGKDSLSKIPVRSRLLYLYEISKFRG